MSTNSPLATADLVARPRPNRRKLERPGGSRLWLHLVLVMYCLTSAAAFAWTVMVSLKSNPEFFSTSPWQPSAEPQFGNFVEAWNNAKIGQFFLNSFYVTSVSVIVSLVVSAMAAYVLATISFRGRELTRLVFLFGLMMPPFLVIIPLYALLANLGLLGSLNGLIFVYIAIQIPFSVYLLTSFFTSLPMELEEAAALDGASSVRTFFSVVVPQMVPALASVAMLNTLTIWNEFFFALVLLSSPSSWTIPVGILGLSVSATYSAMWVQLFAGLVITMIPMLILFSILQERIAKGVAIGGIKG